MVFLGSPDIPGWVRKKYDDPTKHRCLSRRTVSEFVPAALASLHQAAMDRLVMRFGVLVFAPHEAYTTNACPVCHQYRKGASFNGRYRVCPNRDCPLRTSKVRLHRELISVINQVPAGISQLKYIIAPQPFAPSKSKKPRQKRKGNLRGKKHRHPPPPAVSSTGQRQTKKKEKTPSASKKQKMQDSDSAGEFSDEFSDERSSLNNEIIGDSDDEFVPADETTKSTKSKRLTRSVTRARQQSDVSDVDGEKHGSQPVHSIKGPKKRCKTSKVSSDVESASKSQSHQPEPVSPVPTVTARSAKTASTALKRTRSLTDAPVVELEEDSHPRDFEMLDVFDAIALDDLRDSEDIREIERAAMSPQDNDSDSSLQEDGFTDVEAELEREKAELEEAERREKRRKANLDSQNESSSSEADNGSSFSENDE